MKRIYLDYNATTPVNAEVMDEILPFFSKDFGNPSSLHMHGQKARIALDTARERVARALGCSNYEIVFTSGGTESNNLAIAGYLAKSAVKGRTPHVVTNATEHNAVLNVCQLLVKRGVEVTYLPVDGGGIVNIDELKSSIRENTLLVSIMSANNETGVIQPLGDIVRISHEQGVPVHSDAIQAFGKIPLSVKDLGVDMLSISAHKIYAPKGVGALYLRRGISVEPVVCGGSQEKGMRGGTENIPGIVGLGKACEMAVKNVQGNFIKDRMLRDKLQSSLVKNIRGARVNGDPDKRLPNTLSISFSGIEADALAVRLDMEGISVSTGAACSSGASQSSHVLKAMGVPAEFLNSAVRLSIGCENTSQEIDRASEIISRTVCEMRGESS
ncbi:MAG TPA: cysteine desulfurase NifS [Lentisphaeria bacterium]|nr:MAG: cysteine desulfurase NifS [Lentisphaerae bacterium GWF2_50_93]HCE43680.1 cysteine desulfurase NifS [Lentisphaeria bacterium]